MRVARLQLRIENGSRVRSATIQALIDPDPAYPARFRFSPYRRERQPGRTYRTIGFAVAHRGFMLTLIIPHER